MSLIKLEMFDKCFKNTSATLLEENGEHWRTLGNNEVQFGLNCIFMIQIQVSGGCCISGSSMWLVWGCVVLQTLQFTNASVNKPFSSQTASVHKLKSLQSVHKLLQFTNCFSSQTASVHKLLQFTNCFSSQTASVHKLLQFTNCFSSQTASVHMLRQTASVHKLIAVTKLT